jgi:hypothetical protein
MVNGQWSMFNRQYVSFYQRLFGPAEGKPATGNQQKEAQKFVKPLTTCYLSTHVWNDVWVYLK